MAARAVYINTIGDARGDLVEIPSLVRSPAEERVSRLLLNDGFKYFSRSKKGVRELAVQAINQSMEASDFRPSDIDALIIGSESFQDIYARRAEKAEPRDAIVSAIFAGTGLVGAIPYAVWLQGCGNFGSALSVARALILSKQHRRIVIVLVDRMKRDATRLSQHGPTVFSDAAMAAIVSDTRSGYEIRALDVLFSEKLGRLRSAGNPLLHGKLLAEEFRNFFDHRRRRNVSAIRDHGIILADNLHSMSLSFIGHALQVEKDRLLSPTKIEGHCFSADCPRSLRQVHHRSQGRQNEDIALLNIGPAGIAAIRLSTVQ